jgi:hypothetical protein
MQAKHKSALAEMVREPRTMRRRSGKTQIQFWRGYGVTQSGGSRFERNDSNRTQLPFTLALLVGLEVTGKVTAEDIAEVRAALLPHYPGRRAGE